MKAMVFPGQGAQFPGMGQDLHEAHAFARDRFAEAADVLGFDIADIMFNGSDEDLKQTKVTQPAIFLHSVIMAEGMGDAFNPDFVAGHSLGEFSALVAAGGAAAQQKGSTPPPIEFVKVWNDGPESFDELEGKVVILDFGATW